MLYHYIMDINKYIRELCRVLNIDPPVIHYDLIGGSVMAQYYEESNKVVISKRFKDTITPDFLFALAHELRHAWQIKYHKEKYMKDYMERDMFDSVDEYNRQLAELDANAFAMLIMEETFNIIPRFEGLSDETIDMIEDIADEIYLN